MNIRMKFQVVTLIIPVLLVSTIAGYCLFVILPEYSRVEMERMEDRMDHVRLVYDHLVEELDVVNWDWASWDDMYEYVAEPYSEFVESNYVDSSFIDSGISVMLIADIDGEIVYGRYVDIHTGDPKVIPADLLEHVRGECMYNTSGTIILDDFYAIYSNRPIRMSDDSGEPRGSHIMMRIIDESFMEQVSLLTQQEVEFHFVDEPMTWDVVLDPEGDFIRASSLLPDNHGYNNLRISFLYERDLLQRGSQNMWTLILYLVVFGVVFVGVSHYFADKLVLRRLTTLSSELSDLSGKADDSLRLSDAGDDEIGEVTKNINRLLNEIEAARIVEAEQRDKIEEIRGQHFLELVDSVRMISDLLSNEITKPLSAAKNVSYLLREEDNVVLADLLDESLSQGQRMILELASMTNMSELRKTVTDLNEIIEAAMLAVPLPNKIKVEMNLGDEFLALMLDGAKMTQVFENLITNSIEAMPRGGTLMVNVESRETVVKVMIADTGIGISEDEMAKLYQPFYTSKKNAIGFGLVYAKQVVESHGGSIKVESEKGKGTTVTVIIPRT